MFILANTDSLKRSTYLCWMLLNTSFTFCTVDSITPGMSICTRSCLKSKCCYSKPMLNLIPKVGFYLKRHHFFQLYNNFCQDIIWYHTAFFLENSCKKPKMIYWPLQFLKVNFTLIPKLSHNIIGFSYLLLILILMFQHGPYSSSNMVDTFFWNCSAHLWFSIQFGFIFCIITYTTIERKIGNINYCRKEMQSLKSLIF